MRSSHFVNCWYQAHCAWDVFVKDGLVWREEQAADYLAVRPDTPDFNPRGCQGGYSARMAQAGGSVQRVGERGSGQDASRGSKLARPDDDDTITKRRDCHLSLAVVHYRSRPTRWLPTLLKAGRPMNTEIGDGHPGAAVTFGNIVAERSADDYFFSDMSS